ncbi:MAG: DUF934 domain-containing protein [Alphaproteobacteria bacterium]|nr:DUF934 domain-containing protein [Alphaproteobacteria bacterium]
MQIIKDQQIVEDDWNYVNGEDSLPEGKVIVSLDRWKADRETLIGRKNSGLGILLDSDEHADDIAEDLEHFEVVSLNFPAFKDGRPYSTARLLREKYGFSGELRATGDVLRDQLFYMHRCGFDSFEINPEHSIEDALKGFEDFTVTVQPAHRDGKAGPRWQR